MKPKDNLLYTIESYFEYKEILDMHTIYFYSTYMLINDDRIFYTKLSKVAKYKTGLRLTIENQILDIPCEQDIKRLVFQFFKSVSESTEIIDLTHIIGTAILHFGGHYFLIYLSNSSYADFRKMMLKRIAFYFFPHDKNKILLEQFDDFKFYVKDGNNLIPLENNSDLGSALFHFNFRLNVYVKYAKLKKAKNINKKAI